MEKGATEDEMVGWHHQLNGYEFEQTPGESERQGSLVCCNPHPESPSHGPSGLEGAKEGSVTLQGCMATKVSRLEAPWFLSIAPVTVTK